MLSDRRSMSPMSPLSILAVACAFAAAAQGFDVKEIKVGGQHPLYGLAQHGLGKVAEESEIDGQIVGGRDAYTSEFPHQASMQVVMPGFLWFEAEAQHICGGSLIAANWVLTAAHCPYGVPSTAKRVEVVLGINSLSGSSSGQRIVVSKMLVNSKYDPNWNYGVGPYDIALLKLSSNAKLSNSVKLAYLPATGAVPSGNAVVSGWGSTSKNGDRPVYPDKLKTATLPIVDFATCYRFVSSMSSGVNPLLESSNLCTGPLDKNGDSSCSGDSGGPLIQTEGGNAVVVGVVSWGLKHCASIPYPSVFTLTSGFIDWIAAQQKTYP